MTLESEQSVTQLSPKVDQEPKITIKSNYLQVWYRRLAFITVFTPLLGTLIAIALLWHSRIGFIELGLFVGMYAITIFGVEVGFHRYFSHGAFQTTKTIRALLAIFGSMAAQGGVIFWVTHHRRHHQFTDGPGDPHSPYLHGRGVWNQLEGFWHAHQGWMLTGEVSNSLIFAKNLLGDPLIIKLNGLHHIWVLLGLVLPTVLGGVLTWSWMGALNGLLWGGLVRIFVGQQIMFSTNSLCHGIGSRPFEVNDRSTNVAWLAIPSWGQSWHNNHHAFQSSAIAGLKWWQIDPGTWVIRLLERVGLVWNVKVPTEAMQKAKARVKA
jgi:stearoyl-CoA desaturase (Delta-9 desaturase)